MFEKVKKKMAEKMGQSVRTTIRPVATEVKRAVDHKIDLYSRILKLGVLIFLFIDGTKRVNNISNQTEPSPGPNHIVINNYLVRKDGED